MPNGESKEAHPIDVAVGLAVRNRRRHVGMSQHDLAALLGVSFQQVQKYEVGDVRISASRLFEIARALQTTVSFLFLGLDADSRTAFATEMNLANAGLLASPDGAELADLFPKIADAEVRLQVLELVRALQPGAVEAG